TGGKTGTARIALNGKYDSKYNGSFFGFAQDENNAYTIGVVAFESDIKDDYYGARTAAPIFRRIVDILLEENYLTPMSKTTETATQTNESQTNITQ
ncbi:penicillin-binding transpeptidase domain-containing protein, partial [Helicobacter japonicus]